MPYELSTLADDDWVAALPGNPCRDVVIAACEHAGFSPTITHSSDDFHAEAALVAAGMGVALIPRTGLQGARTTVIRPVAGTGPLRQVFAASRPGRTEHPQIRTVLDALRAAATALPAGQDTTTR